MPSPTVDAKAVGRRGRRFAQLAATLVRRPQRPMTLALAAAAAGLIAATVAVIHPANRDIATVPPGAAALVNQQPILMSDLIQETEQLEGVPFAQTTPAQRASVLRGMIDQELQVQRSLALDVPEQDTDARTALVDSVNGQVITTVLATPPTDDELRAYYASHRAKYATDGSMEYTDLVLHVGGFENASQTVDQAMADAAQAIYELRSGAPMEDVKQHFGLVDTGKAAGDITDFFAKIYLSPKLYSVADSLDDGQISQPVSDKDGVHILLMQHRRKPVFRDFDSVRNNVYTDYVAAKEAQAKQENVRFLRRGAQILLAPGQTE